MSDLAHLRAEFPVLRPREGREVPAYLDSACMSLTPRSVLDAMREYYEEYPGCAGRSLHRFAEEVGHRYEAARDAFAGFLGAPRDAIVFLRNATEAINLVGQGIDWQRGDRILVSDQEHNSNLVLWHRLARERGVRIEVLELPEDGSFDGDAFDRALAKGIRLVSVFHTSNLDGRSLPAREVVERAHDRKARVLFDGCQAAPHVAVELERMGADYYALSGHKMLGPTGTGVLAGRPEALGELRPLLLGGETVEWSTLTDHQLRPVPHRFEAGLQNYAGVIGAHAAVEFLRRAGLDAVRDHDRELNERTTRALAEEPRVHVLGPSDAAARASIFAFWLEGVDAHDAALFLDASNAVLVRSGRHCVHSWYDRRGIPGNVRASFYLYNSPEEADRLVAGVRELLSAVPATGELLEGAPRQERPAAAPDRGRVRAPTGTSASRRAGAARRASSR